MDLKSLKRPIAYLTRKQQISCCHRLNSPFLSEQKNREIYGKCNNPYGHGHNYTVEITVRGPIDSLTGMTVNLEELKFWIEKVVMEMDHKNIDQQIDYFKNDMISTTENLAVYVFEELQKQMPKPELLYEVKIHETDKNIMTFRGEYD